jgi:hypothetical protein
VLLVSRDAAQIDRLAHARLQLAGAAQTQHPAARVAAA